MLFPCLIRSFRQTFLLFAVFSSAQVSAAPVVYGDYYDETINQGGACGGGFCYVKFSQTPSDKLVRITRVSCRIYSSAQPIALELGIATGTDPSVTKLSRFQFFGPPAPQFIGGAYVTLLNEETNFLIGQGRFPFVEIGLSSVNSNTCTISGQIVNPLP